MAPAGGVQQFQLKQVPLWFWSPEECSRKDFGSSKENSNWGKAAGSSVSKAGVSGGGKVLSAEGHWALLLLFPLQGLATSWKEDPSLVLGCRAQACAKQQQRSREGHTNCVWCSGLPECELLFCSLPTLQRKCSA